MSKLITKNVVFLTFQGVQSLDLTGPLEVFSLANQFSPKTNRPPYKIILASATSKDIVSQSGLCFKGLTEINKINFNIDTLIITGGDEATLRDPQLAKKVLPWIRGRAPKVRRIVSICTGALVLAATGLLKGKKATTHWRLCQFLKDHFSEINVDPDAIYTIDKPYYCSAGVTAGIDLCLHLIESDCGSKVATEVAKELVLYLRRPGGQSQFSAGLKIQSQTPSKIQKLLNEIIENPNQDLSVEAMAEKSGYALRTFVRTFQKASGSSPGEFVETARIERAKLLLESSDWPLKKVSELSGFGSLQTFHRIFLKKVGVTPRFYRERFRL